MWNLIQICAAKFGRSEGGAIAIMFGLTIFAAVGIIGMAIDYGYWIDEKTKMQGAADAAALAGGAHFKETQDETAANALASDAIAAHGLAGATSTSGLNGNRFEVTIQQTATKFFSSVIPVTPPLLTANAVVDVPADGGPCVLALDSSASNSISLDSNAKITATDCEVHANASSAQGINALSNSHITSKKTCVVGGYGGSSSHYTPTPQVGCATVTDPLASVVAPSVGGCNFNDHEVDNATTTLNPGVYCGGLTIKGNSIVTFTAGTYVIKDGQFYVDSNSQVSGVGVSFYLSGTGATFYFDSNVVVDFVAPTTGDQAGVIFFEDRSNPPLQEYRLDSNNVSRLEGAIYLSQGLLWLDSNSTMGAASNFTVVVVRRLRFSK